MKTALFKKRWGIFVALGLLLLIVVILLLRFRGVSQPIAFNHKVHVAGLGLDCTHCHVGVETTPFATLPTAEICLGCHSTPLSQNPEEEKVRLYGEERGEIPWQRLTRLPDHVYFSHQRHVTFGKVACEACHGKMPERVTPPSRAPVELSMDDCLGCHRQKGASEDCILCHR
ncbi:MAG: cytochrome c3 family protein [Deltaproteobacteria bacterium]|nr:cytochrome c3 family protein [Deltaproteobacteria bacterium]